MESAPGNDVHVPGGLQVNPGVLPRDAQVEVAAGKRCILLAAIDGYILSVYPSPSSATALTH